MITEKIGKFVSQQKLGFVATVSPNGTPNLSPKGTISVLDENTLAFANIRSPQTIENLEKNPSIEINIVDPFSRRGYRFKGMAKIISDGEEYNKILLSYKQNGVKTTIKSIVIVNVKQILEVTSPLYDVGYTEEELRIKWKKYYSSF
jgi:predicted pyridoxine 5'-phosphate oxidase superfamily flavin-nucleotide-binding protein|tara:strand:- start:639 stop:1079 length:441 start_codon:yes stop_codon:yes gene_type:complete